MAQILCSSATIAPRFAPFPHPPPSPPSPRTHAYTCWTPSNGALSFILFVLTACTCVAIGGRAWVTVGGGVGNDLGNGARPTRAGKGVRREQPRVRVRWSHGFSGDLRGSDQGGRQVNTYSKCEAMRGLRYIVVWSTSYLLIGAAAKQYAVGNN